jgi:hypothetical protein
VRRGTRRGSRSVSAPSHQQSWRGETERLNPLAFASHLTEASFRRGAATTPSFSRALLDVSGGRVGYRRTLVRVDNERDANLDRFEQPAGLDLVTVEFDDERQAADFSVPAWFGPEVTNEDHFRKSTLAVAGAPTIADVEVNNAAVIALVEALESAPRLKSRSTANVGVASLSSSDDADRTQPVRLPPVLRLPLPAKLPEVGVAELDPRATEVLDGVAKALERAPTQQDGDFSAETHVNIRRAS